MTDPDTGTPPPAEDVTPMTAMKSEIYSRCQDSGLPPADAQRIYEAVKAFDSDTIRMDAVDALIRAWKAEQ